MIDLSNLDIKSEEFSCHLPQCLSILDEICNIKSLSEALGITVEINLSKNLLRHANFLSLISSMWSLSSEINFSCCGITSMQMIEMKHSTPIANESTSYLNSTVTHINLKCNYFFANYLEKSSPHPTSINCFESPEQLFEALTRYYESSCDYSCVNNELHKLFNIAAIDAWYCFLVYIFCGYSHHDVDSRCGSATQIRSVLQHFDCSNCARNVREMIVLAAGVFVICKKRIEMGLGRPRYVNLRSAGLANTRYGSFSGTKLEKEQLSALDMRIRCELCVSANDEDGEYQEFEYVFD